jgi:Xanthine and CO dehydrogenases maturation factor, XdhC/CoxF family
MDGIDRQVLRAALAWAAQGVGFALVTVARTWGSAPRAPGAWLAISEHGQVQGSVSGGCVEADLIRRVAAREFAAAPVAVVRYGGSPDDAQRFGLPCGGTLELVVESAPDIGVLEQIAARVAAGQLVQREIDIASGVVRLGTGCAGAPLQWDGVRLLTQLGPAWRLLIVGAGQTSRYLAPMAQALGYRVLVCDPREAYAAAWDVPDTILLRGMPDDAVIAQALDPHSAVVALTHDPKLEDMALIEALKSPAFYVGALGSQANNDRRRARLLQYFDLTAAEVARLRGPVGLPIGSRTPPEIALSILAEMTAVKNAIHPRTPGMASESDAHACRVV